MKALITGYNGFVGRHLAGELAGHGWQVVGLDRRPHPNGSRVVDLLDTADANGAFLTERPEVVFHLAGWSHVGESWKDIPAVFRANVDASLNMYQAASAAGAKLVIFISSAAVYGAPPPELPALNERSPAAPDSPYAISKLATESLLRALANRGGPRLITVRPFNHLGRGQTTNFVAPAFASQVAAIRQGLRGSVVHGNLSAARDFLDVRDVVRAYRLLAEQRPAGDLYVVASGIATPIEQLLGTLFDIAGIPRQHHADPALWRPTDAPVLCGDASALRAATGWSPRFTLRDTLGEVLAEAEERLSQP